MKRISDFKELRELRNSGREIVWFGTGQSVPENISLKCFLATWAVAGVGVKPLTKVLYEYKHKTTTHPNIWIAHDHVTLIHNCQVSRTDAKPVTIDLEELLEGFQAN